MMRFINQSSHRIMLEQCTKKDGLGWAGNVVCMKEKRNTYNNMVNPKGRTRRRWANYNERDI